MGFSHETLHFSGSWPSSRLRGTTDPPRSPPPRCSQRLGALGSGLGCHGFPRENHGKTMGEMGKSFTGRGILHGYVKGWCEMTFGKKGKSMEKLNSHPKQKQWSNSLDQANPCKSKQRSLDKKMHPHLGPRRPRAAGRPKGQRPKQSWTKTSPRCGETEWEKIASRAFGLEQSDFNFGFGGGLPSPLLVFLSTHPQNSQLRSSSQNRVCKRVLVVPTQMHHQPAIWTQSKTEITIRHDHNVTRSS